MTRANSVAKHFSAAAEHYEMNALLQARIAQDAVCELMSDKRPERILEIGCGTGILTRLLLQKFPGASLYALDICPKMIEKARDLCPREEAVSWLIGDVRREISGRKYELIVSSSAVHWMPPWGDLFWCVREMLADGGKFCFSLMLQGTLCELHSIRHRLFPHKLPRAVLPSLHEILSELKGVGFTVSRNMQRSYVCEYDSAGEFLRKIKAQGFTGGEVSTGQVALSRGEIELLVQKYQSEWLLANGHVRATYEVGFIEAGV